MLCLGQAWLERAATSSSRNQETQETMRTIDIGEARANRFHLVEQAAAGSAFVMTTAGTPRVRVILLGSAEMSRRRRPALPERGRCVAEDREQRIGIRGS